MGICSSPSAAWQRGRGFNRREEAVTANGGMMPPFHEVGIANEHKQSKIGRKDDKPGRGQMSQAQFRTCFISRHCFSLSR